MRDDIMTKIFIGMVVVGGLLLIYSQKDALLGTADTNAPAYQGQLGQETSDLEAQKEEVDGDDTEVVNEQKDTSGEERELTPQDRLEIESEKVKKSFQDIVKAKMDFPKHLKFISLDLEEGAEVIYGYDDLNNLGVTMMAIPKMVNNDEVMPYLDQSQSYLPDTKENPVTLIGKPQVLPEPKKSSNLKGGTLWSGKLQDGKEIHIAKLERGDEKGTYFFMYTGPHSYFNNNDDYFQSLYDSFEALPEK